MIYVLLNPKSFLRINFINVFILMLNEDKVFFILKNPYDDDNEVDDPTGVIKISIK